MSPFSINRQLHWSISRTIRRSPAGWYFKRDSIGSVQILRCIMLLDCISQAEILGESWLHELLTREACNKCDCFITLPRAWAGVRNCAPQHDRERRVERKTRKREREGERKRETAKRTNRKVAFLEFSRVLGDLVPCRGEVRSAQTKEKGRVTLPPPQRNTRSSCAFGTQPAFPPLCFRCAYGRR